MEEGVTVIVVFFFMYWDELGHCMAYGVTRLMSGTGTRTRWQGID